MVYVVFAGLNYMSTTILFAGSGAIEFDEFVKMYLTLRTKPMDKGRTIKALFQRLDTDNDGHLQFRYFFIFNEAFEKISFFLNLRVLL